MFIEARTFCTKGAEATGSFFNKLHAKKPNLICPNMDQDHQVQTRKLYTAFQK